MDLEEVVQEAQALLAEGSVSARKAAASDRVRTYWNVGGLLLGHLEEMSPEKGGSRAEYGSGVIQRLAEVVGRREREIYDFIDFARKFPILPSRANLTWSHYRSLLVVGTLPGRRFYAREAESQDWTVPQLQAAIRKGAYEAHRNGGMIPVSEADWAWLVAQRGTPYCYRRAAEDPGPGRVLLDLGFRMTLERAWRLPGTPGRGTRFLSLPVAGVDDAYSLSVAPADHRPYCYKAVPLRVVDGDTLVAVVDHGFGIKAERRLRLRGIDAPEVDTVTGQKALAFVAEVIGMARFVVIRSTRPEKYGRYLADVFYVAGEDDVQVVAREGTFLNGELVRRRLAGVARG